jgi:hypothetical protein
MRPKRLLLAAGLAVGLTLAGAVGAPAEADDATAAAEESFTLTIDGRVRVAGGKPVPGGYVQAVDATEMPPQADGPLRAEP